MQQDLSDPKVWSHNRKSAYFKNLDPYVQKRITCERSIQRAVMRAAIKKGYFVTIQNGEDEATPLEHGQSLEWLCAFMNQCDEEHVLINEKDGEHVGWIYFVYGNGGYDVVSDWSWVESPERNTQAVMDEIAAAGDKISERWEPIMLRARAKK